MNVKKVIYLLIPVFGLFSCKKQGCTDPNANNYNSSAKKDNGSCTYLLTDIEGNSYNYNQIGNQVWMTENLEVKKYRNGDIIPQIQDPLQWIQSTTGAWCYYENDSSKGILYNWYAVNDSRGLAPEGWHVPSDAEWTILSNYLGGWSVAGGKMKSIGTQYWGLPNTDATNESGFSGLPGGFRDFDGYFYLIGSRGNWWSSSEDSTFNIGNPWNAGLTYNSSSLYLNSLSVKEEGLSVRCVRD